MPGREKIIILLSVIGTQEILVVISLLIPIAVIVWFVRTFSKAGKDLNRVAGISAAAEIEKLFNLKEKGAITEKV